MMNSLTARFSLYERSGVTTGARHLYDQQRSVEKTDRRSADIDMTPMLLQLCVHSALSFDVSRSLSYPSVLYVPTDNTLDHS